MRAFLIGFPAVLGGIVLLALAFPMGEIVSLHTMDEHGDEHHSVLWIVEVDGALYVRADDPASAWLERLEMHPLVELEREEHRHPHRASRLEDEARRAPVHAAFAEKYGFVDGLVQRFYDSDQAVLVRLEPLEGLDGHQH